MRRGRRGREMMRMMRRMMRRGRGVLWRDLWSRLDIGLREGEFVSGIRRSFLGMGGSFLGRGRIWIGIYDQDIGAKSS
jgi:hypothetical protein